MTNPMKRLYCDRLTKRVNMNNKKLRELQKSASKNVSSEVRSHRYIEKIEVLEKHKRRNAKFVLIGVAFLTVGIYSFFEDVNLLPPLQTVIMGVLFTALGLVLINSKSRQIKSLIEQAKENDIKINQ